RALASLGPSARSGTRQSMKLYQALGTALRYDNGPSAEIEAASSKALAFAEQLDDADYQLRALWGFWIDSLTGGTFREALTLARKFKDVAARAADPTDFPVADRMIGLTLHFLGNQTDARRHTKNMLDHYLAPTDGSHIFRFQYDQRVVGRAALAK